MLQNGLLSSLPTLGMLLLSSTGRLFDWARSSAPLGLGVTSLRKIFNSLGFFIPALAFLCVQLLPCHMKVMLTLTRMLTCIKTNLNTHLRLVT